MRPIAALPLRILTKHSLPPPFDLDLSWDALGAFDFQSSFSDFLSSDAISTITRPQSLADLYDTMDTVTDHFCSPES